MSSIYRLVILALVAAWASTIGACHAISRHQSNYRLVECKSGAPDAVISVTVGWLGNNNSFEHRFPIRKIVIDGVGNAREYNTSALVSTINAEGNAKTGIDGTQSEVSSAMLTIFELEEGFRIELRILMDRREYNRTLHGEANVTLNKNDDKTGCENGIFYHIVWMGGKL